MIQAKLEKTALYIFFGLLVYMPLHIFISTWVGTSWQILPFMKIAKDIALVIGFLCALGLAAQKQWFKKLTGDKLVLLVVAFAGLMVLLAAITPTDQDAEALGVVYNTRFLMMFLYGLLLTRLISGQDLLKKSAIIVLAVSLFVSFFGILQYTVLPDDFLASYGYSRQNGVLPAFFIDDKPDLERVMSTLRDPNSLGSYLLIPLAFFGVWLVRKRQDTNARKLFGGALVVTLLCLVYTFSRSAWLGALAAAITVLMVTMRSKLNLNSISKHKNTVLVTGVVLIGLLVGMVALGDSYFVQNVVFHADESTTLEDPNQLRARFLQESVEDVMQNPLGSGPGTAGLASIKNDAGGQLNENYYLQIATEAGVIGLILFLAILYIIAKRLWLIRSNPYAAALLASFVGLFITNMFVHIWSNEAVAYTWWGLAGVALALDAAKAGKPTKGA